MAPRFITFQFKTQRKEIAVKILHNFRIKREKILSFEAASVSYRVKRVKEKVKEKNISVEEEAENISWILQNVVLLLRLQ